jgi:hypothetical protein
MRRFFFIHVMKTGGTSFAIHHLGKAFAEDAVFPNAVDDETSYLLDTSPYWRVGALRGLDDERWSRTQAVRAHYPFCARHLMPPGDLTVLTVLREPVDRVVSYLRHCQRYHPNHQQMTFEQIYEERGWIEGFATNHQTKVFSMGEDDDPRFCYQPMVVDEHRLDVAKANLATLDLIGTQERFTEFVDECGRRYGWPTTRGKRQRKSAGFPAHASLRRRIEADNEIDIEFYRFAQSIAV